MPALRNEVMQKLYGQDVFVGFEPTYNGIVEGWNGEHPSLKRLAEASERPIVADIGVWKGQSTINMALAMKTKSIDGVVIAIDTFLGSPEHWEGSAYGHLFARKNGRPDIYETFLSNVMNAGVSDYIVPMPQTSVTASMILRSRGIRLALAHIDAAHEYDEVLRDAQEYWSLIQTGGFLIGDDYSDNWLGVVAAARRFGELVDRPVDLEIPKWIVQKI